MNNFKEILIKIKNITFLILAIISIVFMLIAFAMEINVTGIFFLTISIISIYCSRGLFLKNNNFKKVKKYNDNNKISDGDLGYDLFKLSMSGRSQYRETQEILENLKDNTGRWDRQKLYFTIIDLIGEPQNAKERYAIAKAYLWSRSPYKYKGIYYGNLYLDNELFYDAYCNLFVPSNIEQIDSNKEKIHRMFILIEIGKICEEFWLLDLAMECYDKCIELAPFYHFGYIYKAKLLVKLNQKEEALKLLAQTRLSEYYIPYNERSKVNTDFKDAIEKEINDIEEKIQNNYLYKGKKPKNSKNLKVENFEQLMNIEKKIIKELEDEGIIVIK